MERFRRVFMCTVGMALIAVSMLTVGCGKAAPVELQVPQPQQAGQDLSVEDSTADTTKTAALDRLFRVYDLPVIPWLRPDSARAAQWADSVLAGLSLDEKIGQLFIVHLPRPGRFRVGGDRALEAVRTYKVSGFLVPRLLPPRDVLRETRRLQAASAVPLFFAADYERGVGRFNNALTELPSNMALGATRDTLLAAAAGRLTALESRALGVNLLFAPVVDVNNNAENPIINIRSYGEDPVLVGQMATAFVAEAQRQGVLTTLKHFPGHGNTEVDSHTHMGLVAGDAAALDSVEFYPYRRVLMRGQAAAVMSAHLWVPALDDEPLPATFSRRALHDVLRDSLGFEGFVVTDDIRMGALQNDYDADERVVRALAAGADIVLTPDDLADAVAATKAALQRGFLDEAAIDRSVRRILHGKAQAGLHRKPEADEEQLAYLLERSRGAPLAQVIAERAVTMLKTTPHLPLQPTQRTVLVQLSNVRESESIAAAMDSLAAILAPDVEARLGIRPSRTESSQVLRKVEGADVVVLALYLRLQSGRGKAGLHPGQEQVVRRLVEREEPLVLVTFGNPYAVTPFADADALVVAYEQTLESVRAVMNVLQGRQPARGKLPITVDPYPLGSGLSW